MLKLRPRSITNFARSRKKGEKSRTNVSRSKRYFFFFFFFFLRLTTMSSMIISRSCIVIFFLMYIWYVMSRVNDWNRFRFLPTESAGDPEIGLRAASEFLASRYELKTLDKCLAVLYFIIDVILLTPRVHLSDVLNRWLWWWWWWCNNNVYSDVLEMRMIIMYA